ncbi:MAG: ABC transporter [Chloroflexi bacterium 54-19]|nr:MAG: ABC transporter [Chloroflexi bacterium 54-19]
MGEAVTTGRIALEGISKNYADLEVLRDLNLEVNRGEFVTLIGPSGSGKSTVFNILSGLEPASAGTVKVEGFGNERAFAYMPQRDALLPWRNILDNVILGQELQGVARKKARAEALSQLPFFGLEGFEKNYPFELSGGMRQRAALLRTVLTHCPVLLLDEPFGALDALTRAQLQQWLGELRTRLNRTILFITHDVEEALLLSDRVYVLSPRPAHVVLELPVDLDRSGPGELVTSPRFVELKAQLLAALKSEGAL